MLRCDLCTALCITVSSQFTLSCQEVTEQLCDPDYCCVHGAVVTPAHSHSCAGCTGPIGTPLALLQNQGLGELSTEPQWNQSEP